MDYQPVEIADFALASNNSVYALYVVNPEILRFDDESKIGKPFLYYVGRGEEDTPARLIRANMNADEKPAITPFVGKKADLDEIVKGRRIADSKNFIIPHKVDIGFRGLKGEELASGYVPFSFGVFHEGDLETYKKTNGGNVREDIEEFKQVLERYDLALAAKAPERSSRFREFLRTLAR